MIKFFILPAMVVMNIKLIFIKLIFHHAGTTCQKFSFVLHWVPPLDAHLGLVGSCTLRGCAGSTGDDEGTSASTCLSWSPLCVALRAQVALVPIIPHLRLGVLRLCCALGWLGRLLPAGLGGGGVYKPGCPSGVPVGS